MQSRDPDSEPFVSAVLVAAGSGRRLGAAGNKVLLPLAGSTILRRALEALFASPRVRSVRLVVRQEDRPQVLAALTGGAWRDLALVDGGEERVDSVQRGLAAIDPKTQLVLVHDAARPLLPRQVLEAVIDAGLAHGAAIPCVPVTDTLKRTADAFVGATIDRRDMMTAQTPQAATPKLLRDAFAHWPASGPSPTDEAQALEHAGVRVAVVPGDPRNLKITTPADLALAAFLSTLPEEPR